MTTVWSRLQLWVVLAAAMMIRSPCGAAAATITDLAPIDLRPGDLRPGVNTIAGLAPDGRTGVVVHGVTGPWQCVGPSRRHGNAWGYDVAMVSRPGTVPGTWNLVRIDATAPDTEGADVMTDTPHTFEHPVNVFRFARAHVDGRADALLLMATRDYLDAATGVPGPSLVMFGVYRLEHTDDGFGTTPERLKMNARFAVPMTGKTK